MEEQQSRSWALGKSAVNAVSRSISVTHLLAKKSLWVWPIVAAVLLLCIGWTVRHIVETSAKQTMAANLQTILEADVEALRIWLDSQRAIASSVAADRSVRERVLNLAKLDEQNPADRDSLLQSDDLPALRQLLQPELDAHRYLGFAVLSTQGRVLASTIDGPIGRDDLPMQESAVDKVLAGETSVMRPFKSLFTIETADGQLKSQVPVMFAFAPVRDDGGAVVAALGMQIRPEIDFTRILSIARAGDSGETYAFDAEGLLLSQSRFDENLKQIGLLPDEEDVKSILNVHIRDPRVNMVAGGRPVLRLAERPLTRMAADAVAGNSGVDVDGYNDYRGVPVIGAWTWMPEYGIGVATEVDVEEAYSSLFVLRYTFYGLLGLVAVASVAIFVFTVLVARTQRQARHEALKAKRLGQYSLDEKIGAGGMGVVYRGHHSMLRRPTAIKLLDVDKTTDTAISRFEREVQLTAQLSHPNTIAIYDYGRTPEGIFYYAMEYLEGIDLDRLVKEQGPQPEARVIHILVQLAGSLAEAHATGLIHRDIKPANVILSDRGGVRDFVKLLDFGLVKATDSAQDASLTAAGALTGTPLYMSPEAIERVDQVDARSDIYALGAVGYFLLTGTPVFDGDTVMEICMHHIRSEPQSPSERLGRPIMPELETLILQCLAKPQADRPQSAAALRDCLNGLASQSPWRPPDTENLRERPAHTSPSPRPADPGATMIVDVDETES